MGLKHRAHDGLGRFSLEELVERRWTNDAIGTLRKPLAIQQLLQTIEALSQAA
jgi:hypothetical protein